MVALEFLVPKSARIPLLQAVGTIGFAGIMIGDWLTANRWERERGSK